MDRRVVLSLFRNDLRLLVRSGRTIFLSVILPLLVFPLILAISHVVERRQLERQESATSHYQITGNAVPVARVWLERVDRFLDEQGARDFHFAEQPLDDPEGALVRGELQFYIRATRVDPKGPPAVEVFYRGDRDDSARAGTRIVNELDDARRRAWDQLLVVAGLEVPPDHLFPLEEVDVASAAQTSGLMLGRFLTTLLVTLLVSGGSVVAMDSLAGEKERGTLETLLTTAASRTELVLAKGLSIYVVAIVITAINVLNLLAWIGLELIPIPAGFALPLGPAQGLLLLVLYLPVAALVSSLLLLVSGRARTYKEAQLYLFPLTLLCVAPTLVAAFPGMELRSVLAIVPFANLALAAKEVLSGVYDWPFLALAWISALLVAAAASRLAIGALSNERLIATGDFDAADFLGGEALLPRHVLRWYAGLWAVFLLAQINLGPPRLDVRILLLVNMGLMLTASLLVIRVYRLDPRRVLALRLPPWSAWIAVAIGVPSAAVLGIGVSEISGLFLPVPQSWIEAFNESLVPKGAPFWTQMLPLLTLLPGLCEEITFRGVLLYGLHRRLRPVPLALAVGGIFGIFHVDLFRLLPTAFLGVVLAGVTLVTGSIFPAMVWHMANNALLLAAGRPGAPALELGPWHYAAAVLVFAVASLVLWRWRRPYPDLQLRRSRTGPQ